MPALSGTFTGAGPLAAIVAPTSPSQMTLGQCALGYLAASVAAALIIVDFGRRKVGVMASVAGDWAALEAAINDPALAGYHATITPEIQNPLKTSGEWTLTLDGGANPDYDLLTPLDADPVRNDLGDELNAVFGPSKPSKNFAGVIDGFDAAIQALTKRDIPVFTSGFFMYDQLTDQCLFVEVADTAAVADFAEDGVAGHVPDEFVTQTPITTAVSGTPGIPGI